MKLIYFSSKQYPSTMADGLFVAKAAAAMARALGDRFLFITARDTEQNRFPGVTVVQTGIIGRFRTVRHFFALPKLRRHFDPGTIIYSNEQPLVLVALLWKPFFRYTVVYEAHGFFNWRRDRIFLKIWRWCIDGIVATSDALGDLLIKLEPGLKDRIHVVRGGYDPKLVDALPGRDAARAELGIAPDAFVVGYSGHFKTRGEKGIATLLEALPAGVVALLIGGKPGEIAEYRVRFPDARAIYKEWTSDQRRALGWLQAADVLAIPASRDTLYTRYSFPMKAYDYLALGRPIVVSDMPIIREVLDDAVARACIPGDAAMLAAMIDSLVHDTSLRTALGQHALARAREYTWDRRAQHIAAVTREFLNE